MRGPEGPRPGGGERSGAGICLPALVVWLTSGRARVVLVALVWGALVLEALVLGGAGVELSSGESSQRDPM